MSMKRPGFSLVQTILVTVILGLTMTAAIMMMVVLVNSLGRNQSRITATYLAQECMEMVRNARDSAWRQNLAWNCAFDDPRREYRLYNNGSFPVTADTDALCKSEMGMKIEGFPIDTTDDFANAQQLKLLRSPGLWHHDSSLPGATQTPFHRSVRVTPITADLATYTCRVFWYDRGDPEMVEMAETLTHWLRK